MYILITAGTIHSQMTTAVAGTRVAGGGVEWGFLMCLYLYAICMLILSHL